MLTGRLCVIVGLWLGWMGSIQAQELLRASAPFGEFTEDQIAPAAPLYSFARTTRSFAETDWSITPLITRPNSADANPFVRLTQSNPPAAPAASANADARSAKSGTGMDSLPSFRGMKGIRNLPGGVGTLLMANPHIGGAWYPEQSTDQPNTSLSMERLDFQGAVPMYSSGQDTYVLTADVEILRVNTNAILPTTMQPFPGQLFNIAMGVNYFHQFDSGKVGGIVFEMGSASDKPFAAADDLLVSGTGFLLIPDSDEGSWFVGVNASTNSQVLHGLPIPGGGYFFHPSDDFQAIVGLPFSVISWKPSRDWQLQFVYAFLTTTHARVSYQPTQKWQLYAGFDWTNENWDRADRPAEQDRFFYYEKKLSTGFLWWIKPNVGFEIAGGWAFDRYFTEVDNGFNLVGDNTVNVNSGPYILSQLSLRF